MAPEGGVTGEQALKALTRVADPELAVNIVDLGLVYGLEVRPGFARVKLTMTSASCPVTEVIVSDVYEALGRLLGEGADIDVEVVWEPPWGPERMSEKARSALGWDEG